MTKLCQELCNRGQGRAKDLTDLLRQETANVNVAAKSWYCISDVNTGTAGTVTLYTTLKKQKFMLHAPVLSWDQSIGQQDLQPGSSSADSPSVCLAGLRDTTHNRQLVRKRLFNIKSQHNWINLEMEMFSLLQLHLNAAKRTYYFFFTWIWRQELVSTFFWSRQLLVHRPYSHDRDTTSEKETYTLCHFVNKPPQTMANVSSAKFSLSQK